MSCDMEPGMRSSKVYPTSTQDEVTPVEARTEAGEPQDAVNDEATEIVESNDGSEDDPVVSSPQQEEIWVVLDYEPRNPDGVIYESESESGGARRSNEDERTRSRRRVRTTTERSQASQRQRPGFFQFYTNHWVGQVFSGVFTGLIFFVIGIVFIVYFNALPDYVGVLFILVSLPPCCMAINRWRYGRLRERNQRRTMARLNAIRRRHLSTADDSDEDDANRQHQLPVADLPPDYSNLAFDAGNEQGLYANPTSGSSAVSLNTDVVAPPAYDDVVKLKQLMEEQRIRETNSSISSNNEQTGTSATSSG